MSRVRERVERYRARARRLLEEPEALRDLLARTQGKYASVLASSDGLRGVADEVSLMVALLRAWVVGDYDGIARSSVLSIVAALLYFVVPLDGIPDFLLGLGYVDDIAVLGFVIQQLRQELDAFRRWQASHSAPARDITPPPKALPAPGATPASAKARDHRCAVLPLTGSVLIALLLLSGGCSLKLAYNNADRLIRWGIDDFVDINAEQRRFLDDELARILYWHRTTQLPIYAGYIDRLNLRVAAAAGQAPQALLPTVEAFGEVAEGWGAAIEAQSRRLVLQMLLSLTEEQLAALPERMRAANEEFAETEQSKSVSESRARWSREYAKFFKRFTGRLTDAQQTVLDEYAARYEPQTVLWTEYRERWQGALLDILLQHRAKALTAAEAEVAILAMNDNRERYYGDFGPAFERNEALAQEAAAAVLVALTERQRRKLDKRVAEVTQALRELVEEAPAAAPAPLVAADCLVIAPGCP